ncbi:MAG: DUF3052 domain-containing protein [Terriglobia bacterium]
MAGYSGTPLAKKLGIKEGSIIVAVDAPDNYTQLLEPLPEGVQFSRMVDRSTEIVHHFSTRKSELAGALALYRRKMAPQASVWVSWPKKTSKLPSEISENIIREIALPLGFVDVKVCAIDETWSGLKLVVRKELR